MAKDLLNQIGKAIHLNLSFYANWSSKGQLIRCPKSSFWNSHSIHTIHVWYTYLDLVDCYGTCRQKHYTWMVWALFFICCFVCFYFVGQKFLQFVSEMCLASVVLHRSLNHYLCWGLNSDSFHTIGEGHNPIVGVYIPILRNSTKGRMTISNLRNLDPTTFGKYDFTVFLLRLEPFFGETKNWAKVVFLHDFSFSLVKCCKSPRR